MLYILYSLLVFPWNQFHENFRGIDFTENRINYMIFSFSKHCTNASITGTWINPCHDRYQIWAFIPVKYFGKWPGNKSCACVHKHYVYFSCVNSKCNISANVCFFAQIDYRKKMAKYFFPQTKNKCSVFKGFSWTLNCIFMYYRI